MICPRCGNEVHITEPTPEIADVKALIERLPATERAMLRPWVLARFDVRGTDTRTTRYIRPPLS